MPWRYEPSRRELNDWMGNMLVGRKIETRTDQYRLSICVDSHALSVTRLAFSLSAVGVSRNRLLSYHFTGGKKKCRFQYETMDHAIHSIHLHSLIIIRLSSTQFPFSENEIVGRYHLQLSIFSKSTLKYLRISTSSYDGKCLIS